MFPEMEKVPEQVLQAPPLSTVQLTVNEETEGATGKAGKITGFAMVQGVAVEDEDV